MKQIFIAFAASLAATAAQADSYFVQSDTIACPSISALMHKPAACAKLAGRDRVEWDGKIINDAKLTSFTNVGKVAVAGKPAFVYANFLKAAPPQDPLQRQFTLAHDAIACPTRAAMEDGMEATIERDQKWFGETGCVDIPKGTSTSRLAPEMANQDQVWLMRVRISHSAPSELWMNASEFR